jgi:hypothetical protein
VLYKLSVYLKVVRNLSLAIIFAMCGFGSAQSVRYGDVRLVTSPSFAENVQDKAVVLQSSNGNMEMYVFCVDSRTANVSLYIPDGDFAAYGYRNGARIPVVWQADQRRRVSENWQVIGQNDDLRRYGQLGLITAELFSTKQRFAVDIFQSHYIFPARGINTALRQLTCVVPFLKGMGYNTNR